MKVIMLLVSRKIFKNKKRLVVTVLALSFGVALLVSIQSAIQNTKDKFGDVMNSEISNADIVIQSISYGLIEDDLSFLDEIDNVKSSFPRIEIELENGKEQYQISGVIEMQGLASKQNGIICLLPLDATREVLNTDKESLVNVILKYSTQREQTVKEIENQISDSTTVYYPERKNEYYMDTLEGFFLGLNIFSLVVIFAAGFIIYNTISKFVS